MFEIENQSKKFTEDNDLLRANVEKEKDAETRSLDI